MVVPVGSWSVERDGSRPGRDRATAEQAVQDGKGADVSDA